MLPRPPGFLFFVFFHGCSPRLNLLVVPTESVLDCLLLIEPGRNANHRDLDGGLSSRPGASLPPYFAAALFSGAGCSPAGSARSFRPFSTDCATHSRAAKIACSLIACGFSFHAQCSTRSSASPFPFRTSRRPTCAAL